MDMGYTTYLEMYLNGVGIGIVMLFRLGARILLVQLRVLTVSFAGAVGSTLRLN